MEKRLKRERNRLFLRVILILLAVWLTVSAVFFRRPQPASRSAAARMKDAARPVKSRSECFMKKSPEKSCAKMIKPGKSTPSSGGTGFLSLSVLPKEALRQEGSIFRGETGRLGRGNA